MPITTIPMVLNILIGFAVWISSLSTITKTVITAILIVKYVLFFSSVWVIEAEHMRKIGVGICIAINLALLIFSLVCAEFMIAVSTAIILIFLILWSIAAFF